MGEADLAHSQRRSAFAQTLELPAGVDAIPGGATGQVAVGLDPRGWTDEALLVVFVGLGEVTRHARELHLE
jgi:hypothetical protein